MKFRSAPPRWVRSGPRRIEKWSLLVPVALAVALSCLPVVGDAGAAQRAEAASSSCAKTYTFRYGDSNPPSSTSPETETAQYFAKKLHTLSKGCITVQYFPNGELGTPPSLLTGVRTGSIDFAAITTGTVAALAPKFYIFTFPFLMTTRKQVDNLYNSKVGQQVLHSLKPQGATGLLLGDNGPFMFTFKSRVNSTGTFQGQKVRAYPDPLNTAIVQALGAQAVPIDPTQIYTSLLSGVITGAEASSSAFISLKLQEVAKYTTILVPDWTTFALFVSNKTMASLPKNLQRAVLQASNATGKFAQAAAATTLSAAPGQLKAAGFTVTIPKVAPFRQAAAPVIRSYTAKIGPATVAKAKVAVNK